jgi:MFS family permease
MSTLVQLLVMVYSRLLRLYPRGFVAEFGVEVQSVFADAAAAACERGLLALMAFCWREIRGLLGNVLREKRLEMRSQKGARGPAEGPLFGRPAWIIVGLALTPGLVVFCNSWSLSARHLVPTVGLGLCILLGAGGLMLERRVPPWSYPALGLLFGMLIRPVWMLGIVLLPMAPLAFRMWFRKRRADFPRSAWILVYLMVLIGLASPAVLSAFPNRYFHVNLWDLSGSGAMLLVIAVGLLIARNSGVLASLFVAAAGFVLFEQVLDFTYGLWKTPWGMVMVALAAFLLLMVSPVWMLCAGSRRQRTAAALLPPLGALAFIVVISAIVRTQPAVLDKVLDLSALTAASSQDWRIGVSVGSQRPEELWPILIGGALTAAHLFLGMVLTVILYRRFDSSNTAAPAELEPAGTASAALPAAPRAQRRVVRAL